MPTNSHRYRAPLHPLAAGIALALAVAAPAAADSAKEQQLEERIAQLEKLVAQMRDAQAQKQEQGQKSATPAAGAAAPAAPTIQDVTITPNASPVTRFNYGGFIKLDAMYTDTNAGEIPDGTAGRMFYLPSSIPVGGVDESGDLDAHAQLSRFWFGAETVLSSGDKLKSYLEFDLFGGGSNAFLGNETATNTFGLTVRHAYVGWNNWLAGQTWSNFQDVAALPDTVDFIGPSEATIFVRQAQLRYTNGPWSFSAENPETTVTPYLGTAARFNSDDNNVPDLTARWMLKGSWGHFTVAGLLRQFKYQNPATGVDDSANGAALSLSGKWNLGTSDDLRFMLNGGSGIGRYLGLGIASDTVLDTTGSLEAVDAWSAYAGWRHVLSAKWRTNLFYSRAQFDHDTALTGLSVTRSVHSAHANIIYTPLPKLDIGTELIWGERELETGADGELRRLHMHVKYNF